MAADLITRIILNDNQFNDKLKNIKKELDVSGSIANGFSTALKGVAGSLGLIMGAQEAFNKLMDGSQAFGDSLTLSLNAVSDSVDEMFYSLGTGDFSAFNNGLDNIIAKSKAATAALDQLGNTRISYGYFDSYYNEQMSDSMLIAKNKQLGTTDREKGFADWDSVLKKKEEASKVYSDTAVNAVLEMVKKGSIVRDVGLSDVERIVKIDILPAEQRDSVKSELSREYKEYEELLSKVEARRKVQVTSSRSKSQTDMINEGAAMAKQNLANRYAEAIIYSKLLAKDNDTELRGLVEIAAEARQVTKAIKDQRREYNESIVEFRNSVKSTGGDKSTIKNVTPVKPVIPQNSIAELEDKISKVKAKLRLAVDDRSRAELYLELNRLENTKHVIEFQYKHTKEPSKVLRKSSYGLADLASKPDNKIEPPIQKKDIRLNEKYANSLMSISSIMGSLSAVTGEGAAAWVGWSASIMQSIAAAIPAIQALTAAESTEAVVGGIKSATKVPFVGWLMAGAAAASVIAAIMSIPKFQSGGIIPGNSTIGDNLLARVNSGEMILNTSQQANLFRLLNSGSNGDSSEGKVKFEIEGQKLVGVIKNYNNRRNKIL